MCTSLNYITHTIILSVRMGMNGGRVCVCLCMCFCACTCMWISVHWLEGEVCECVNCVKQFIFIRSAALRADTWRQANEHWVALFSLSPLEVLANVINDFEKKTIWFFKLKLQLRVHSHNYYLRNAFCNCPHIRLPCIFCSAGLIMALTTTHQRGCYRQN